jgi:hypothetical protein
VWTIELLLSLHCTFIEVDLKCCNICGGFDFRLFDMLCTVEIVLINFTADLIRTV